MKKIPFFVSDSFENLLKTEDPLLTVHTHNTLHSFRGLMHQMKPQNPKLKVPEKKILRTQRQWLCIIRSSLEKDKTSFELCSLSIKWHELVLSQFDHKSLKLT